MKRIVREVNLVGNAVFFEGQYYQPEGFITFEQAFAEYPNKPIVVKLDNSIEILSEMKLPENLDIVSIVISLNNFTYDYQEYVNHAHFIESNENEKAIFYQANSWHDLHINVIPTLMKMAEAGK